MPDSVTEASFGTLKSRRIFPLNVYTFTPSQITPSSPFSVLYGRIGKALIIISAEMIRRSNRDRMPFPSINAGGLECLSQPGLSYGLWRAREERRGDGERDKDSRKIENETKFGNRKKERVKEEKITKYFYLVWFSNKKHVLNRFPGLAQLRALRQKPLTDLTWTRY